MARKISVKQAIAEMAAARADFQRFFGDVDPDHPFLCTDCNDETPIGCPVCCLKEVVIEEPETEEAEQEERYSESEEPPRLLREERCSDAEQAHTLLREDAFPPARDEPGRACWEPVRDEREERSPRPEFLEPEPVSPRATKRASRAAQIARWRKANGWTGPFVRFAGEDADCYDAE